MKIHQLWTKSTLRNFSYIIEYNSEAICIDPFDVSQSLAFLKKHSLKLTTILNTHEHWDHTQGNEDLRRQTKAQIWAHEKSKGLIPHVDRYLKGGEKLEFSPGWSMEVINSPGHTFAHLCFLILVDGQPQGLFSGDTLFNAGVGNCRGGDPQILFKTITKNFGKLSNELKIYPGHEYLGNNLNFTLSIDKKNTMALDLLKDYQRHSAEWEKNGGFRITTLGEERQINLFLKLDDPQLKSDLMAQKLSDKEMFLKLRAARDLW
jgi:hydroxyacylglutathione hydrolase